MAIDGCSLPEGRKTPPETGLGGELRRTPAGPRKQFCPEGLWASGGERVLRISEMPKRHFSNCPVVNILLTFMHANLLSKQFLRPPHVLLHFS